MKYTSFAIAALLAIQAQALELKLNMDIDDDDQTTIDILKYASNYFRICKTYQSDSDLPLDCHCAAWHWDSAEFATDEACAITTLPDFTQIDASTYTCEGN